MTAGSAPTGEVVEQRPASAGHSAARRHVLDLDDYSRDEIEQVLTNSSVMHEVLRRDIKKVPALRGKSVVTLFLEPSTRTRVSFEHAAKILSADTINVAGSGSSAEKGESLYNTALTLQAMNADIIVIRHPHAGLRTSSRATWTPASSTPATAVTHTRRRRCSTCTRSGRASAASRASRSPSSATSCTAGSRGPTCGV